MKQNDRIEQLFSLHISFALLYIEFVAQHAVVFFQIINTLL